MEVELMEGHEKEQDWSNMLPELLQFFSDHLPLLDYLACRGVCKNWRSALSNYSNITSFSKKNPWFMFYDFDTSNRQLCYLYDPSSSSSCCITHLPHLQGATCIDSKAGWLLCRRGNLIFFYHPFCSKIIDLPPYPSSSNNIGDKICTFSSVPNYVGCTVVMVFALNSSEIEVSICRVGDPKWTVQVLKLEYLKIKRLRDVWFCRCYKNWPCSCSQKSTILIFELDSHLIYNFVTKEVTEHDEPMFSWVPCAFYAQMANCYKDELMSKFGGKEGISISLCSIKSKSMTSNYGTGILTAADDDVDDDNKLRKVKGVWIDPIFKL